MNNNLITEGFLRDTFSRFVSDFSTFRVEQFTGGHINLTYFVEAGQRCGVRQYILQRVNSRVFPNVTGLMENVLRISEHLAQKTQGMADAERSYLHFYRTLDGAAGIPDADGFWRLYKYVPRAHAKLVAETPKEACEAAKAFGLFQAQLADLPGPRLVDTIPQFHDTRNRFRLLEEAVAADSKGRLASAKDVLEGMLELRAPALHLQKVFEEGAFGERIVHNDAKYSNVLLDETDFHAVCVIDLDTCMPGLSLHDFGDLVRSMVASAAEDEKDVSKIFVRKEMYDGLCEGFLSSMEGTLTAVEKTLLANGGLTLTVECGIRFLTDYLQGDTYFRTAYPEHNLVRARSQLALARSIAQTLPVVG